jgi:pilus assembly protein CpaE
MDRPSVLLAVTDDAYAYHAALTGAGFEVREAASAAEGTLPDLAVIDCDIDPEAFAAVRASMQGVARGGVPTLLLLGDQLPDLGTAEMRDDIAVKPLPAEALIFRLQAMLIRSGRSLPAESGAWADLQHGGDTIGEGHVISVFAPKGGVGKTTISVNLAVALREQTRASVLLFDADVGVGNITAVFEAPVTLGLADLADSPPEEWTDAAFEHLTTTHAPSGLRVLTWGTDPGDSERVSVDLLLAALRWARSQHAWVIVDNHPGYADRTMAMLTLANEILLVVTPEMGSVRNSSQFLDLARQLGLADVTRVVVNRANHGISVADISSALGMPVAATIVSNGPKAVIAANEGMPVITKFPKERIATDMHQLARVVTRQPAAEPAAQKRGWLPRFASRGSHA